MKSNLKNNLIQLEQDKVLDEIESRLEEGEDPLRLIEECNQAMTEIGEKYKAKDYFLAELMASGEIFKEAMKIIDPYLGGKIIGG